MGGGFRIGTHVHPWLIHVNAWQNQYSIVKQNKVRKKKKNLSAMQETCVPSLGQEDPLEKGNSYPLQYSCLKNSMDRRTWLSAVVRGVTNRHN